MKKIKTKFITLALASAFITVGYSTAASADSVAAATKYPTINPAMIVTTFSNVEFQGGSSLNGWYFWMNSVLTQFFEINIRVNIELFKHRVRLVICWVSSRVVGAVLGNHN